MSTNRLTRAIALTAGGLLLAGGAAVATAGTATAAEPTHAPTSYSAHDDGGYGWGHHDHDRGYGDYYGLVVLVPVGGYGGYYGLGGFPGYY
ncbi:hypothetical protein ACIQU1_11185 [Streptomyces angustmyceticus]|uniref:hypothetical protein n=1 Tax=Streptomyces angustmyceticus TaxID=285578 RepID=UPI00344E2CBC